MNLPKIDETINNERAIELCTYYGYHNLVDRIKSNPDQYKEWVFDGASMLPDKLVKSALKIPNLEEIALRHDLKYAYGEPGNKEEKLKADKELEQDLLDDNVSPLIAKAFFVAVDQFGTEEFKASFSWGFAHV